MPISYEVTLSGMRFHARVGILPHERELAQPITLDVTVWRSPAQLADVEASPLDYRALASIVTGVMAREPIGYLETIAAQVASEALSRDGAKRVRVSVRKPHVALGVPLDGAEVVVDARRDA